MSNTPISPLRARMIEDMTIRGFSAKTQSDYIRRVKRLTSFLGRSPDRATSEDLRRFQLQLAKSGTSAASINATVSALRFFFAVTLGRDDIEHCTQHVREPRKLPVVLSPEEVARLLDCAPGPGLKYKAALSVAYGAGLRASEVVSLKVADNCDADGANADRADDPVSHHLCPCCGGRMIIIETFEPGTMPRHLPLPEGIDSS